MSKGTILITDSLFISKENEDQLTRGGYNVVRLNKPKATEDELCVAIKGKVGYILGGIENVTNRVIDSSDSLKAIAVCATDWTKFIAGPAYAKSRGIGISYLDTYSRDATAEYTVLLMLAMLRNVFDIGRTGPTQFYTADSIWDQRIGLIGMGRVGSRVAEMLRGMGVSDISYYSRTRHADIEEKLGIQYKTLDELLKTSTVVSLHIPSDAGEHFLGTRELALMSHGSLLVNTAFEKALDLAAAFTEVSNKRLHIAHDGPVGAEFKDILLSYWFNTNQHSGFNTKRSIRLGSDSATTSLLNLLETGKDQFRVN